MQAGISFKPKNKTGIIITPELLGLSAFGPA